MSFRKVTKRKANKTAMRRQKAPSDDDEEDDDTRETTADLLFEARKRTKNSNSNNATAGGASVDKNGSILNTTTAAASQTRSSNKDLATSTAQHLPESLINGTAAAAAAALPGTAGKGQDGIFRNQTKNKFHAGPIRAAGNIRVTARFDYQPDICKDYKETGFCGFGDTCIYLHDRGDTLAGWQLEQQWEEQQRKKKEVADKAMQEFISGKQNQDETTTIDEEDGLPFACHLCRKHFTEPVVTNCLHYFCQDCILQHVQQVSETCPICSKDTGSIFNKPTKLEAKKRRALGAATAKQENSWELFLLEHQSSKNPSLPEA